MKDEETYKHDVRARVVSTPVTGKHLCARLGAAFGGILIGNLAADPPYAIGAAIAGYGAGIWFAGIVEEAGGVWWRGVVLAIALAHAALSMFIGMAVDMWWKHAEGERLPYASLLIFVYVMISAGVALAVMHWLGAKRIDDKAGAA
jgi:hypothetical protein